MRVTAALIGIALLTGCGGGGERKTKAGDGQQTYREQAQRACTSPDRTFAGVTARGPEIGVADMLKAWRPAVQALGEVKPPAAQRDQHAQLVDAARELERTLQRRLGPLTKGKQGPLADRDLQRAIRTRSAADSLRIAGDNAGLKGCGQAATAAADRLMTLPYAVLAASLIADYRRTLRAVQFEATAPAAVGSSVVAYYNAAMPFHRNFGSVEPPSAVARQHERLVDAADRAAAVLVAIGNTEAPAPTGERGQRILRRAVPRNRALRRAQKALLAATDRALG